MCLQSSQRSRVEVLPAQEKIRSSIFSLGLSRHLERRNIGLLSFVFLLSCLFTACNTPELRPDYANPTQDASVQQMRLEFSGCGSLSQVGTLVCNPKETLSIITEFPGDVIFTTEKSSFCSSTIHQEIPATVPETSIAFQSIKPNEICDLSVYYWPEIPGYNQTPGVSVFGLYGVAWLEPDSTFQKLPSSLEPLSQNVETRISGAKSLEYVTLSNPIPTSVTGDTIDTSSNSLGRELLQIKRTDTNPPEFFVRPMNFYADNEPTNLVFGLSTQSDGSALLTLSDAVSAVSVNGSITQNLQISLDKNFTGFVRAYTVKGRTNVIHFSQGKWVSTQ